MKKALLAIAILFSILIVSCGLNEAKVPAVYMSAFNKIRAVLPPDGGTIPGGSSGSSSPTNDGGGINASTGGTDGGGLTPPPASNNDVLKVAYDRICPMLAPESSVSKKTVNEAIHPVLEVKIPAKNFRTIIPLDKTIFARSETNFSYLTSLSIPHIDPSEFQGATSGGYSGSVSTTGTQYVGNGSAGANSYIQLVAFDDENNDGVRTNDEEILSYFTAGVPTRTDGSPQIYQMDYNIFANRYGQGGSDQCESFTSPLVMDLSGEGFEFSAAGPNYRFDLNADGVKERTGWVTAQSSVRNGFLARDVNHNGIIDDGSELFGNYTKLPSGELAPNGFEALRALDSNGDGFLDDRDAAFGELVVWRDYNLDGVSQAYELDSLASLNIKRINIKDYLNLMETDPKWSHH